MLAGVAYFVIGVGFGALAGGAASLEVRQLWRLGAWAASFGVYAAHIGLARLRRGDSPRATAAQAALAAALAAFGLAVVGPARMALVEGHRGPTWLLALVLWPVLTGVPAFLVALVVAIALSRWAPRP
jgi:hypothetical protein